MLDSYSRKTQLALTAIGASCLTAGVIIAYTKLNRSKRRKALGQDVRRALEKSETDVLPPATSSETDVLPPATSSETDVPPPATSSEEDDSSLCYDDALIREQLARNYAFFGEEGMQRIRNGRVVIVGCGGVGSWAAVMLVRSGVSNIRLVDFDYVTLSSLNRHATACLSDVGTPKVKCIAKTLKQISRWVEVDCRVDIWRKENGETLLEGADWVVDAIDNITTKVDLLKYCHDNNIKVFSSMGAGAKCDPTRIQISDISYTVYDPLSRAVRRRLRLQGVTSGIPVVYSTEVPGDVKLLPLPGDEFEKGDVKELGALDDFRVRILPVLGPLPAIFGLHAAAYIICELAGAPILNPLPIKKRRKLYERLLRDLLTRESKLAMQVINRLPIDEDDVELIFEDVHRGRSAIPPHVVPSRPTLVRWDSKQQLTVTNCVVMDQKDAEKHLKLCFGEGKAPSDVWSKETIEVVRGRQQEIQKAVDWVT